MKLELNFSSKESATGLISHWKKKNTTFLHLVRDRRVYPIRVTHLQTMRQILFRTLWHTRRQRPLLNTRLQICFVTQLHTLLQTHSSFFCTWRFSPSNHKKNTVSVQLTSRISFLSFSCMSNTSRLHHSPHPHPPRIWTFEDWFVLIPDFLGQNSFKCPTQANFFEGFFLWSTNVVESSKVTH